MDLAGIGISFGSACTSGTEKASNILLDMGLSKKDASSTVRISFGKIHSLEDVSVAVNAIHQILILQSEKYFTYE